jgi:hypothetical protein
MGASLSTLGGWALVLCVAGYYAFRYTGDRRAITRTAQPKRVQDSHNTQPQKESKDKAKRQRKEAFTKDTELTDKATKLKQRVAASIPVPTTSTKKTDDSSDDNVDNREFAKQLASIKQGTSFNGPKKSAEKKQKSVKQSRAQEKDTVVASKKIAAPKPAEKVSAPSSTTGADGDDDQSSTASPEVTAADAGDVSDMLERPSSTGPSILRLTETDKATTKKAKKAKAAEKAAETKKQRQNKAKVEAAKAAREEAEADRKVKLEAQRRLARISEGRAAKDGSSFIHASQPKSSAWTAANGANGVNGTSSSTPASNGDFIPVQPLDTFGAANGTHTSTQEVPKPSNTSTSKAVKANNWVSSLPSEEEQMTLLQDDDNWNTVESKKSRKKSKVTSDNDNSSVTSSLSKPQQVVPVESKPVMIGASKTRRQSATKPANARPTSIFAQQSSFAALSNDDGPQEEQEWDV